jgi:hypothetical protein
MVKEDNVQISIYAKTVFFCLCKVNLAFLWFFSEIVTLSKKCDAHFTKFGWQ